MFPPNTYLKILNALGWSIARANTVKIALNEAELSYEVETEVKELLERLKSVDEALFTERGSANAGLVKADVLEWASPEARSSGMVQVKADLTSQLANLLGLNWSNTFVYPGGANSIGIRVE